MYILNDLLILVDNTTIILVDVRTDGPEPRSYLTSTCPPTREILRKSPLNESLCVAKKINPSLLNVLNDICRDVVITELLTGLSAIYDFPRKPASVKAVSSISSWQYLPDLPCTQWQVKVPSCSSQVPPASQGEKEHSCRGCGEH